MQTEIPANDRRPSREEEPWISFVGPAFLLCTLAVALWTNRQEAPYWLGVSLAGMICALRYRMRGCLYVLALLAVGATLRHWWFLTDHLWHIGMEGSLACGLLITALAADQRHSLVRSFREFASTQKSTIGHLEQNVAALMSSSQAQQIVLQEKISQQQKELEETQSELSSITMLNEVLRRTSAGQIKESEELAQALLDRDRRIGCLLTEREELHKELSSSRQESALHQENERLLQELNGKRVDEAQLLCLGETLAHLQERLLQQEERASEQLQALAKEKQKLHEELTAAQTALQEMELGFQQQQQRLEQEAERLLAELEAKCKQAEKEEDEKRRLQEERAAIQAELQEQQAAAARLLAEFEAKCKQEESALHQIEKEAEEKLRLEEELGAIQIELQEQQAAAVRELEELGREKKTLHEDFLAAELQLQEQRKAIAGLTSQLEQQEEKAARELERLDSEKSQLQEELLETRVGLQEQRAAVAAFSSELEQQKARISQQLEEFGAEKRNLQEELAAAQKELQERPLGRLDETQLRSWETTVGHLQEKLVKQESLASQRYHALALEKQKVHEEFASTKTENKLLQAHVQQLSDELAQSLTSLQMAQQLQVEKTSLQERLRAAELEIANLRQKAASAPSAFSSPKGESSRQAEREGLFAKLTQMQFYAAQLEEKIQKTAQLEGQYLQLRAQFEEKNTALHEARAQLFRTDTELKKQQMENTEKELRENPYSKEMEQEFSLFEQELKHLRVENEQLQQMVADLLKKQKDDP